MASRTHPPLPRILSAPVFGHLATVRHDGALQVNPMWSEFDAASGTIRFTHTTTRRKFENLQSARSRADEVRAVDHRLAADAVPGSIPIDEPVVFDGAV
ncbi:pyridoxamine 5'-phosphate oxidase family protein [Agromyces sp. NPDC049794]|uniref:pyridoxamine 5'-phosphate oxidase family protein n=1 Tax=unclassified Agromyces TaxID=2639701 RepID=UPI0033D831A4